MRTGRAAFIRSLMALAATPSLAIGTHSAGPGVRLLTRSYKGSLPAGFLPAAINRHTGRPHEHKREIARRQRQAARV